MAYLLGSRDALRDADTKSLSPAYARKLSILAGRVRYLFELATGANGVDTGEPHMIPQNPQGLYGVDHSGPPWGSAFLHPIMVRGGMEPDSASMTGHRYVANVTSAARASIPIVVWQRPFEGVQGAPYSRAQFAFRWYNSTGGAIDVDATVRQPGASFGRTSTLSIASGTSNAPSADCWADMKPGWNSFYLDLSTTNATGVHLLGMSLNNYTRRSHI